VKVVPGWREDPRKVRELDWHFQLEGLSEGQQQFEGGEITMPDVAASDNEKEKK
jgi:hypothetical protein